MRGPSHDSRARCDHKTAGFDAGESGTHDIPLFLHHTKPRGLVRNMVVRTWAERGRIVEFAYDRVVSLLSNSCIVVSVCGWSNIGLAMSSGKLPPQLLAQELIEAYLNERKASSLLLV